MSPRLVYLLPVLLLLNSLSIGGCTNEAKRETTKSEKVDSLKKVVLPETPISQEVVEEEVLPQQKTLGEPEETQIDTIETMQGQVTGVDAEMAMVMVEGTIFDAGSYDSSGVQTGSVDLTGIRVGDRVQLAYTKKKHRKVLESIEVLSRQRVREEIPPQRENLQEPEKAVEEEVLPQRETLGEPEETQIDTIETMQGQVTGVDAE
jgi:hypothetical protein